MFISIVYNIPRFFELEVYQLQSGDANDDVAETDISKVRFKERFRIRFKVRFKVSFKVRFKVRFKVGFKVRFKIAFKIRLFLNYE